MLGDFNCIVSEADALGRNGKVARRRYSEGFKNGDKCLEFERCVGSFWERIWIHPNG